MTRIEILLLILLVSLFYFPAGAAVTTANTPDTAFVCDTIHNSDSILTIFVPSSQAVLNLSYRDSINTSKYKSKKRIAAILSFPIPFGLLGLHRVFLGTKPYIPFVYIGTLGGCFLILPLIDFIATLSADEETFKKFENNPKVFMWSH